MLSGFFGLATAAIGCNFAYPSEQVKFLFLLRALARLSLREFWGSRASLHFGGSVSELQLAVPIRMVMAIIAVLFRWRMQPRRGCIAVAMGANPWVLRPYKEPPVR